MTEYCRLIEQHETEVNRLHAAVRETYLLRKKSQHAWRDWKRAAKCFREYRSEVDDLIEQCIVEGIDNNHALRTFAFGYLKSDPYFFRSGYALERLLQHIKKLDLTASEKVQIQDLILQRIDTKALRNFRHICRLVPLVDTDDFISRIETRLRSDDPNVRRRAEFATAYFPVRGTAQGGFQLA
ncbi:hypothetical protein [Phycobacter sp. K97]|uniref:hypothetical protein n=1 Tax=Phycobacter sedimenti TaxID=3133977 RepID=UPI00312050EE